MNDFNLDRDEIAAYVREARRMRSEAVSSLLVTLWTKLAGLPASAVRLARAIAHRRKWNLSVPAPHR